MKTTDKIRELAKESFPTPWPEIGNNRDIDATVIWFETPVKYETDFHECNQVDLDFALIAVNNAARMAEIIERTREFLGRRYELEGERAALTALIDVFQKGEGNG